MRAFFEWLTAKKLAEAMADTEAAMRRVKYAQEQATRPESKVEALARAYCEELGYDPDGRIVGAGCVSVLRWVKYRDLAEAALHKESMAAALRKVGG